MRRRSRILKAEAINEGVKLKRRRTIPTLSQNNPRPPPNNRPLPNPPTTIPSVRRPSHHRHQASDRSSNRRPTARSRVSHPLPAFDSLDVPCLGTSFIPAPCRSPIRKRLMVLCKAAGRSGTPTTFACRLTAVSTLGSSRSAGVNLTGHTCCTAGLYPREQTFVLHAG
jgi:hypothetical protein